VDFKDIDNPGKWSSFAFQPRFLYNKSKPVKYLYHAMPAGCTPVPKDDDGVRSSDGFTFYHNGWTRETSDPQFQSGATRDNLYPAFRKGCLDANLLSQLGMAHERMIHTDGAPDALFFYQLLLPIHDTLHEGTFVGDPRIPYYPHVAECTEVYAIPSLRTRGSGQGHCFKETSPQEMLQWDGVVVMDGVLGGSRGAILRRFDRRRSDNTSFCRRIADTMTPSRFLEIKRAIKLNNNLTATQHGEPNHDPAQKYDYIFKCVVHNTNALTKHACLDLCGDETTWMNASWAEKGSGIIRRGIEKPGGSKGGQLALVTDVDRIRVRAHVHRHKLHPKHFTTEGANEVKMICDQLLEMLINQEDDDSVNPYMPKQIFREKPHITWDNYFSGDQTMQCIAEKGLGITCTVNRDCLPGKVPKQYWHKEMTKVSDRHRAARYKSHVVAIKRDPTKWGSSVWQHTSFQSTSSCSISHVNAINHCSLFATQKERGRALFKRTWAIENNESRQLYLSTYGKIDRMDHMIKNCNIYYR